MFLGVQLALRLLSRAEAERVAAGRPAVGDPPWAEGYPLDGDVRACVAYASRMGETEESDPFGYYQLTLGGEAVGGAGFHGPPAGGVAEIGYGVVPSARGQGIATAAVLELLEVAARLGATRVVGRTTAENLASQRVMLAAGMRHTGCQGGWLCFEVDLAGALSCPGERGPAPGRTAGH